MWFIAQIVLFVFCVSTSQFTYWGISAKLLIDSHPNLVYFEIMTGL